MPPRFWLRAIILITAATVFISTLEAFTRLAVHFMPPHRVYPTAISNAANTPAAAAIPTHRPIFDVKINNGKAALNPTRDDNSATGKALPKLLREHQGKPQQSRPAVGLMQLRGRLRKWRDQTLKTSLQRLRIAEWNDKTKTLERMGKVQDEKGEKEVLGKTMGGGGRPPSMKSSGDIPLRIFRGRRKMRAY
ncbi:hypothetical protein JOL62DRAFT_426343 [Phyllosticta paracitricarpa]|uniref:Uncharacterized protein n=1 Tax=Phyllosticta paracitricarpa TaxID=2016321 RepID=A0ABR1NCX9_9PEZI